eukprot:CAMPEP_0202961440 /NCGR_PEP_ID=MMETSP1396-20130829/5495_1 /ASSEMBLY_ACC=CAM_ASM_000872 /TAXON_ID= /ORGANISM="Pseudokeronopsis sp., Strain Brazil" /LENGTH=42 /DNA_ID= /DNA_START= /DNA_END= /DNA_ORIENTATION=
MDQVEPETLEGKKIMLLSKGLKGYFKDLKNLQKVEEQKTTTT